MLANKVIYGNIVTMNEKQPRAQAMAIRDGRIAFVGSKDEAQAFLGKDTEVVDFGSETVYPGMIDVHNHMGLLSTVMSGGPHFTYGDSYEKNVRELIEFIKENPGRDFYRAYGYSPDPLIGTEVLDLILA